MSLQGFRKLRSAPLFEKKFIRNPIIRNFYYTIISIISMLLNHVSNVQKNNYRYIYISKSIMNSINIVIQNAIYINTCDT